MTRERRLFLRPFLVFVVALLSSAIIFSGDSSLVRAKAHPLPSSKVISDKEAGPPADLNSKARFAVSYGRLPLHFIPNQGQVQPQVKFYAKGLGHSLWFTQEGVCLTLRRADQKGLPEPAGLTAGPGEIRDLHRFREAREKPGPPAVVWLKPVGLQKDVKIAAVEPLPGKVNYFIGNDPKKWRRNVPTYRAVVYREAYPGVDLKFYGSGRQMEYDVIVKPGADLSRVRFKYDGARKIEVTPEGDLAVLLPDGGRLLQRKPRVCQIIHGRRVARAGKFQISKNTAGLVYGFEVAAYDSGRPLVIDPQLVYSTYLGGSDTDAAYGIVVDAQGFVYVVGQTWSDSFPVDYPLTNEISGGRDAFVAKLLPDGELLYFTYLGGSSADLGWGIAVDAQGSAYVAGETYSYDFSLKNPLQSICLGITDGFVAKLSADGNLLFSTFFGGIYDDALSGIAVDALGQVYLAGSTSSPEIPVVPEENIRGSYAGGGDAFVAKLSPDGREVIYFTYLGGSQAICIAIDSQSQAYVAGLTYGDLHTVNSFQNNCGGRRDAFVAKLRADGSIIYSTYLGGGYFDGGYGIAVDAQGRAYVTGHTGWSEDTPTNDFPVTENALQGYGGWVDAFVTILSADGSLLYSTFLGGRGRDQGYGIAVDPWGRIYVTGETGGNFPTKNSLQDYGGGSTDVFVSKLNVTADRSELIYSTYLGGGDRDAGFGIAVDAWGKAFVAGLTESVDFPTRNSLQSLTAVVDAFVAKISHPLLDVPLFDQNDPEWACDQLGRCRDTSLGECDWRFPGGCTVTCLAMIYNFYVPNFTNPKELNESTKYVRKCSMKWPPKNKQPKGAPDGVIYDGHLDGFDDNVKNTVDSYLLNGNPVLADVTASGIYQHFVVITGKLGETYYINDPWDGKYCTLDTGSLEAYTVRKVHFYSFTETQGSSK